VNMLYLGQLNLLYPFPPPPIIQQLSLYIVMSSTCADVKYYWLSFSPFPLPPSSILYFLYFHLLQVYVYTIMFVFVCMFWICLSHMRENLAFVFLNQIYFI
jgi:hypothetical protein